LLPWLIAIGIGMAVGALSGFYGGLLDGGLMRFTDLFLALPQLPLVLMVIYLFGEPRAQNPGTGTRHLFADCTGDWGVELDVSGSPGTAGFLSLKQRTFRTGGSRPGRQTLGCCEISLGPQCDRSR
jgi:peptide/nickel transport system permease protein